jgi:hypothetical protein
LKRVAGVGNTNQGDRMNIFKDLDQDIKEMVEQNPEEIGAMRKEISLYMDGVIEFRHMSEKARLVFENWETRQQEHNDFMDSINKSDDDDLTLGFDENTDERMQEMAEEHYKGDDKQIC